MDDPLLGVTLCYIMAFILGLPMVLPSVTPWYMCYSIVLGILTYPVLMPAMSFFVLSCSSLKR